MAALAFIRLLEDRGLLDPEIVSEITRQVETSKVRITPEMIAKLLVDNGQLTRFQATKLITELNETVDRPRNDPTTALRGGRPIDEDNDKDSVDDLLPEDWKSDLSRSSAQSNVRVDDESDDIVEAIVIDDDDDLIIEDAEVVDAEVVDADSGESEIIETYSDSSEHIVSARPNEFGDDEAEITDDDILDAEVVEDDALDGGSPLANDSSKNKAVSQERAGNTDRSGDKKGSPSSKGGNAAKSTNNGTQSPSRQTRASGTKDVATTQPWSNPPPPRPKAVPSTSPKPTVDQGPRRVVATVATSSSTANKKNAWDSFRILGIGSILGILLLILIPLLFWFVQGSADEAYKTAMNAYETRNYTQASKGFRDFASSYPRDANASSARVLGVLAAIRENAERVSDPLVALQSAQDLLPTILSEDGLAALRPDMTDSLLRIAEKFTERIESTADLEERKKLISSMSTLLEMVNDSRYLGPQDRAQNALRIRNIEEGMSRANRGVQRDTDRLATIENMTNALAQRNVSKTYEVRRELLRKYPMLEGDAQIGELLEQATAIQRDLIVDEESLPEIITTEDTASSLGRVFLAYRDTGKSAESLSDEPTSLYINSKGSLVSLDPITGAIRWQKFIDGAWHAAPIFDPSNGIEDVTISLNSEGIVRRYSAENGQLLWEGNFHTPIFEPKVETENVFIVTTGGAAYCLDKASGNVNWAKKFPQGIGSPMGGASNKRQRYVVAENSNLYAISRVGGACEEVEYLGHQTGTIRIAPIWLLNHLLVFENSGADFCTLRIFETDSEGLNIRPSEQLPIKFRGHFAVAPEVDGRRFALTTNLGEFAVFEIDPSNKNGKVQKVAGIIEQEIAPRVTWPKMVGADLFLASNRIALYEIQVSSQRLNRAWQREDGDEFTTRPVSIPQGLVHTRLVRGNLGTRVSLIEPKTGEMRWETDVSVPITTIAGAAPNWMGITTQGALFRFTPDDLKKSATLSQTESLGKNQRMLKFDTPFTLPNGRTVVFNSSKTDQLLLVDPNRKQTAARLLSVNLGNASVTQPPVLAGTNMVLALSNSQITQLNTEQLQPVGSPFQPTLSGGEKAEWLNPVTVQDGQSIIVADRTRIMYKLTAGSQLTKSFEIDLDNPLTARMASLDNLVFAISSLATADQIEIFDGTELKNIKSVPIDGRVVWGPYAIATPTSEATPSAMIVLQSDLEGIMAFDAAGKKVWTKSLEKNELVDAPQTIEGDMLVGTIRGEILRVQLNDGSERGSVDVGEDPSASPVIVGGGMLIPTNAGSVITLAVPSE